MDITSVFRTTVKGIKLAAKRAAKDAAKAKTAPGAPTAPTAAKSPKSAERGLFAQSCIEFTGHLASLELLVTTAQAAALRISGVCSAAERGERAQLDSQVSGALRLCQDGLAALSPGPAAAPANPQTRAHRDAVTAALGARLQQLLRAQQQYQRLCQQRSRLEGGGALSSRGLRQRRVPPAPAAAAAEEDAAAAERRAAQLERSLSPAESAQLCAENATLCAEFDQLGSELRVVEGRLGEVARLQEDFTCRVLEQDAALERVTGLAVHAVENMGAGNEQLRSAMQNQASFRFWILFYLLVTSLTLWFLDWYNP